MSRLFLTCLFCVSLLAACGTVVTISVPGGVSRSAPPPGFELLFSPAPHAFAKVETPVRRGNLSERYELRDGDCGGSDCGNYRARAEITEIRDRVTARLNRDFWVGWSFYNENIRTVTRETSLNTVFGQWRLAGEQPSLIRFIQLPAGEGNWATCNPAICNRGGAASDDVVVQLDEIRQSLNWGAAQNNGNICRLWGMEANRGRWVDVVMNTNFGTDGFGYLRIWINGELRCNYTGQIVSAERARTPVLGPSNRRGIFASYTQRWAANQGSAAKPTMVAYYDEYRTGLSRGEVDTRLREASGLPAVD